jgi:drug/metabolite transporter (DMT)-like permease
MLGIVAVIIFGATLPMTRLALESFDPLTVTVGRAFLAGTAASATLILMRRGLPRRHIKLLLIIGACVVLGFPGFSTLAMRTVPAAHGGVVLGLLPLGTALAGALFTGDRPSRAFWLWAIAGAAIVIAFTLRDGNYRPEPGDGYLLLAAAAASTGYALSGRLAREMPGWEVISWVLVVSLPISSLAMLPLVPSIPWNAPATSWAAFLYLGLMSQFVGFFAWNTGLALGGVARVGQVQLLQTFVTLALSAVLLHEVVDAVTILAGLAVATVVFLGRRAPIGRQNDR